MLMDENRMQSIIGAMAEVFDELECTPVEALGAILEMTNRIAKMTGVQVDSVVAITMPKMSNKEAN